MQSHEETMQRNFSHGLISCGLTLCEASALVNSNNFLKYYNYVIYLLPGIIIKM